MSPTMDRTTRKQYLYQPIRGNMKIETNGKSLNQVKLFWTTLLSEIENNHFESVLLPREMYERYITQDRAPKTFVQSLNDEDRAVNQLARDEGTSTPRKKTHCNAWRSLSYIRSRIDAVNVLIRRGAVDVAPEDRGKANAFDQAYDHYHGQVGMRFGCSRAELLQGYLNENPDGLTPRLYLQQQAVQFRQKRLAA